MRETGLSCGTIAHRVGRNEATVLRCCRVCCEDQFYGNFHRFILVMAQLLQKVTRTCKTNKLSNLLVFFHFKTSLTCSSIWSTRYLTAHTLFHTVNIPNKLVNATPHRHRGFQADVLLFEATIWHRIFRSHYKISR
jgi:hypothetical protein